MIVFVIACVTVAMADAPASTSPASSASGLPDPYVVFSRAIRAMRAAYALGRPPYLSYTLDCDTHNLQIRPVHTKTGSGLDVVLVHADHHYAYQVWYRTKDGRGLSQDLATKETFSDALFDLSPQAFDESPEHAKPSPSPGSMASPLESPPSLASPPLLGRLSIHGNAYYTITMVGLEQAAGGPAYHLHLVALSNDKDHPLTDLWVDPTTSLVRKARAVFTLRAVAFGGGGEGDETFGPVGKYWLPTGFDVAVRGYAFVWHFNVGMAVRAHDIIPMRSLPDSYFATPTPSPRAST